MRCLAIIHLTVVLNPHDSARLCLCESIAYAEIQLIHFHQVQKTVDGQHLFNDLTLFLPKPSYTLLSGGPQSGKTTLLNLIMAFDTPDQGSLRVDGLDLIGIPAGRIPFLRRQIGLIANTPALLEDRSVIENISVPLQLAGFDQDVINERLNAMLEFIGLREEQHIEVTRLTKPLRQLVSAARATIHKPPVILADEPIENIDADTADLLIQLLDQANTAGAAVLITCKTFEPYAQRVANNYQTLTLSEGSIKQYEPEQHNSN